MKMFPPVGHCGISGMKANKDGTYDVPADRVVEMTNVHGFRSASVGKPLTDEEVAEKTEERRRESASLVEQIAVLNAEVSALTSRNKVLERERDGLSDSLRRATKGKGSQA